jgi:chromosome partitioning protein
MLHVWANKKGGVGKSTLAVHYAVWLFDRGFKTALLDADEQRSSSKWLAQVEPKITISLANTPETCVPMAQELKSSHDFVVGDAPGGMGEISRTMLILADLALFPIGPAL